MSTFELRPAQFPCSITKHWQMCLLLGFGDMLRFWIVQFVSSILNTRLEFGNKEIAGHQF